MCHQVPPTPAPCSPKPVSLSMRARSLLEAGMKPAEVAGIVGFADQAHLTRWFRRVTGATPAAYRNSVQDGGR
ncbi:hypothetical protein GCM10009612_43540 [Streptomyces beijiangensis]